MDVNKLQSISVGFCAIILGTYKICAQQANSEVLVVLQWVSILAVMRELRGDHRAEIIVYFTHDKEIDQFYEVNAAMCTDVLAY